MSNYRNIEISEQLKKLGINEQSKKKFRRDQRCIDIDEQSKK